MSEFPELLDFERERLRWLNDLPLSAAREAFLNCCGSSKWADFMARGRPFADLNEIVRRAQENFDTLAGDDWKEAFAAHPRIGEAHVRGSEHAQRWAQEEQSAAAISSLETERKLQQGNEEYYSRFGYIFIICATGKSADQVLASLGGRLKNDPAAELQIAANEQRKITLLRLQKIMVL